MWLLTVIFLNTLYSLSAAFDIPTAIHLRELFPILDISDHLCFHAVFPTEQTKGCPLPGMHRYGSMIQRDDQNSRLSDETSLKPHLFIFLSFFLICSGFCHTLK